MEATNMAYRSINQYVLANAPCSVEILVDKGLSGSNHLAGNQVSHHVAVLFFGGPDDREALCYGWRMVEHHGISLTIMRFVQSDQVQVEPLRQQHGGIDLEEPRVLTVQTDRDIQKQHDEKLIHEFRMRCGDDDAVDYVEKVVSNGEDTVTTIRTMDDIHDLFIVGRGQGVISPLTAGLTDWSECPETGAIGDMLASSNFAATTSVLVVQQYVGDGSQYEGLETPYGEESTPLPPGHKMFTSEH
ncbi:Cation/H(+) antiporter 15 [Glycine soja]|uniref:Cation/H(+) antiporter 15 n=1 Tax=Glycine soja TaxID=3848 RepID=A0A445LQD3_GLYSO|nr:Cation/H(+) antiporter 15 [Glycine soja]